ncbi:MAG: cysteine desulfurase family protein [Spirochaetales bacterium]|nr:cysteine desulfurase family protein [Spirochaetales bacterium]
MIESKHYFDWAATTPPDREILTKALDFSIEHWGNPSSIHKAGTDARAALEETRKNCAEILGVKAEQLYFTSGGTESDHLALLQILTRPQKGSILLSAIEHPALREMAKMVKNCGWKVITVNPDKNGTVQSEQIIANLQEDTAFVTVMSVNNETGAVQNIYDIADKLTQWAKGKRRPFFHVDCVQAAGKIPLNLSYPGIDSASFSAHKIRGPRGIGLLYSARPFTSFLKGGGQEKNIRSGTENLFGAKAFELALEKYYIREALPSSMEKFRNQQNLTKKFIQELGTIKGCTLIPHCRLTQDDEIQKNFSPYVIQASFPGIPGQVMERALSTEGFYISTGSACSSGHHSRPVLDTMQISGAEKEAAVRFSFGPDTQWSEMNDLLEKLKEIALKFAR